MTVIHYSNEPQCLNSNHVTYYVISRHSIGSTPNNDRAYVNYTGMDNLFVQPASSSLIAWTSVRDGRTVSKSSRT